MNKPEQCKKEHLEFLDNLRERGITNMFGAVPYLMNNFAELDGKPAKEILSYWMETFSERHKNET